jgi:hypothetical protein
MLVLSNRAERRGLTMGTFIDATARKTDVRGIGQVPVALADVVAGASMGTLGALKSARLLCVRLIGRSLAEFSVLGNHRPQPVASGAAWMPETASSGPAGNTAYRRLSRPWSAMRPDRF